MIGMTVVDTWKIDRMVNEDALTIKEYGDMMGYDMMKAQETARMSVRQQEDYGK